MEIYLENDGSVQFWSNFIQWIKTVYSNPVSSILNNGYTSGYFSLERGVRQGDPLSPVIIIMALELLAVKIREDPKVEGIKF